MNLWVVTFLMFLICAGRALVLHKPGAMLGANVINMATGIMVLVSQAIGSGYWVFAILDFGLLYLSISVSLNILLTLMIAIRLVLHDRNIRTATGSPAKIDGLYKTIATMLVGSPALDTVSSFLATGIPSCRSSPRLRFILLHDLGLQTSRLM